MTSLPASAPILSYSGDRVRVFVRAVLLTYGTRCHLCGEDGANSADHIIPRSVRPDLMWDLNNARPAHKKCNVSRGAKPLPHRDLMAAGW